MSVSFNVHKLLSAGLCVKDSRLVVSEKIEGVLVVYLPIESLGLSRYRDVNPVPTNPLANVLSTVPSQSLIDSLTGIDPTLSRQQWTVNPLD